ncbi:DUF6783 domain-containing protein [uncultured Robinsoniella sp.]|uniref:DUF6783 domain-containing protein n=1 Tax=uncultured Robinsoniella sp. TaxID=904190 RepID=UPI00374E8A8C
MLETFFLSSDAPLCGIVVSNSGYIARKALYMRDKSPTCCVTKLIKSKFLTSLKS